ncbi:hypothetical protein H9L13_03810 [Sphingomonas lutea]|uniref:Uncharacterized protein n=1 Tax=Sphingomonas lutea TaxID=1045317 RepID=A0A7G9SJL5_9SPHN|nr:hypothetical protein [Sphingomonas lutea]QNN68040.1 hypothetical protein H9L13_03810 [Sphingomonas lutea]
MEPDARYFRRRASEELAAANRAVTAAARERRMQLAGIFLERLKAAEASDALFEYESRQFVAAADRITALEWSDRLEAQSA